MCIKIVDDIDNAWQFPIHPLDGTKDNASATAFILLKNIVSHFQLYPSKLSVDSLD